METLPEYTIVYGAECSRRIWKGEGRGQSMALHVKHLEYLREMLPKSNKLRMFLWFRDETLETKGMTAFLKFLVYYFVQ